MDRNDVLFYTFVKVKAHIPSTICNVTNFQLRQLQALFSNNKYPLIKINEQSLINKICFSGNIIAKMFGDLYIFGSLM